MKTSREERLKHLKPLDPWEAATPEGAQLALMIEAQSIPLSEKLRWLEEAYEWTMRERQEATPASSDGEPS